jgi:hypothetical protein
MNCEKIAAGGLEPLADFPRETAISENDDADSDARNDNLQIPLGIFNDPDLADLIRLWPKLPATVRNDVLAVVRQYLAMA